MDPRLNISALEENILCDKIYGQEVLGSSYILRNILSIV